MIFLLSLLILLFLPGYIVLRCEKGNVPPACRLARRAWLRAAVASAVITSWMGLLLLEAEVFSARLLLVSLCCLSAVIYLRFRPALRGGSAPAVGAPSSLWPLAVILVAFSTACLASGVSEYVFGGWDSGEYVNIGALVSEKGRLVYRDDFFASLRPADRMIFTQGGRRYMGFDLLDPAGAVVSPKFMPIYPIWLALAASLSGVRAALSLNILFALVSIALCYRIALRLGGRVAAFAAAAFLASSAAELWFARAQCAEPLAQLFFLGAVYFWVVWGKGGGRVAAPLAGASLAMAALTKLDCAILIPCAAAALLFSRKRKEERAFVCVTIIGLVQLAVHLAWWSRPYAASVIWNLTAHLGGISLWLAAAVVVAGFAVALTRLGRRGVPFEPRIRYLLAAALFTLAFAAYFLRPAASTSPERANIVEFSAVAGGGLFWWAVAAFVWVWVRGLREGESLIWFSALGVTAFFALTLAGEHHLWPWAARRFVPVTLPSMAVFSGCLAGAVYRSLGRRARIPFSIGLCILAVSALARYPYLLTAKDYRGGIACIERLRRATAGADIVICEQVKLALPLDFLCGRKVLLLPGPEQTPEKCARVEELIEGWLGEGKRVLYVTAGPPIHGRAISFSTGEEVAFRSAVVPLVRHGMPVGEAQIGSSIKVLEAVRNGETGPGRLKVFDIDSNCFGLERGFFHGRRIARGGERGRWTGPASSLIIPWVSDGGRAELVLSLAAGRLRRRAVPVEIFVEGERIGLIRAGGGLREYRIPIPEGVASGKRRVRLELRCPPWNPAASGLEGYPEELGIFLDKITVEEKGKRADAASGAKEASP